MKTWTILLILGLLLAGTIIILDDEKIISDKPVAWDICSQKMFNMESENLLNQNNTVYYEAMDRLRIKCQR